MSRRFAVEDFETNADRFAAYEDLCDRLEAELSVMTQRAEAAEAALKPNPLPEGLVPHAYQLASTIQNADYWYKASHAETNTGKAVMCMAQAMFAWKNAALDKAEDCFNYEARIKVSQEQEPVAYVLSAEEAARTDGRTPVLYIGALPLGKNLYAAPVIPPDVAELQRENAELRKQLEEADTERIEYGATREISTIEHLKAIGLYISPEERKLLAEAKSKAVPDSRDAERYRWLRNVLSVEDIERIEREFFGIPDESESVKTDTAIDKAMFSAAPQPETDIDHEQRFK